MKGNLLALLEDLVAPLAPETLKLRVDQAVQVDQETLFHLLAHQDVQDRSLHLDLPSCQEVLEVLYFQSVLVNLGDLLDLFHPLCHYILECQVDQEGHLVQECQEGLGFLESLILLGGLLFPLFLAVLVLQYHP